MGVNFWLSLIFSSLLTLFFGLIFDWGTTQVYFCGLICYIIFYVMGMSIQEEIKMDAEKAVIEDKIAIEEAENRELINKALKHYAETKGIK